MFLDAALIAANFYAAYYAENDRKYLRSLSREDFEREMRYREVQALSRLPHKNTQVNVKTSIF